MTDECGDTIRIPADVTLSNAVILFVVIALASWLAGFGLRRVLTLTGIMDRPRAYSSHDRPVPRGGGLLIVIAFFAWYFFGNHEAIPGINCLAAGVAAVAVVSFLDDIRPRSRRLRFVVYTIGAAIFVSQILGLEAVKSWGPAWLMAFLLWLWVAGYANAFNFIDGIDGLAATHALAALIFGALLCLVVPDSTSVLPGENRLVGWGIPTPTVGKLIQMQLVLAGAVAGFLAHNVPRARLFLGDVGSIATGFLLAAIAVLAGIELGWKVGMAIAALHLGPVLDTGITLARRLGQGKNIADRHREFFFHRAVRSGRTHLFVTRVELMIQFCGGLLLLTVLAKWNSSSSVLIGAIATIAAAWIVFFLWCEKEFRKIRAKNDAEI